MTASHRFPFFAVLCAALLSMPLAHAANDNVEDVVVRSNAHFDFNSDKMVTADQTALLAEVGKMKDVSWQKVTATGHTDSVGAAGYNRRLSERRARAVKAYMVRNGLDAAMVRTMGLGAEKPVAVNDTEEGRASNRRTEVEFRGVRVAGK